MSTTAADLRAEIMDLARSEFPDAVVTVRYGTQTIPNCLRSSVTAQRPTQLGGGGVEYGAAFAYAFSVRIDRDQLRGSITPQTRMTVDKTDYMIMGWEQDAIGATIRVDLGEENQ